MENSVPENKVNVGIAAGEGISAAQAIVKSTGEGTQAGLMGGRATHFENELVQATVSSTTGN